MATRYGMWRDLRTTPNYQKLAAAGITPLFHADNDPNLIGRAMEAARAVGLNPGIWAPANAMDPQKYAAKVATMIQRFNPAHVNLNVEVEGKGYPGSPQWEYSERLMQTLQPYLQGREFSVSPMGMQDDFNYGAYTSRGGQVWAQAYHGNMDPMDPQAIVERLMQNNVPASMARAIIGSRNDPRAAGDSVLYGLEDFAENYPLMQAARLTAQTTPVTSERALQATGARRPAASSPKAQAYARAQIVKAMRAGHMRPVDVFSGINDPAAIWRQASAQVARKRAAAPKPKPKPAPKPKPKKKKRK